jgi:hypothetical protein
MEFLADGEVPLKANQAWTTGVKSDASGTPIDFTGYAICRERQGLRFVKEIKGKTTLDKTFKTKVMCPGDSRVVSGGYDSGGNQDKTYASTPIDGKDSDKKPDDGWMARIVASQGDRNLRVRATCSSSLDLSYATNEVSDDGAISAEAACPNGTVLSGGGEKLTGDADSLGTIYSMVPVDIGDANSVPGDSWLAEAYAPVAATITTTAICLG